MPLTMSFVIDTFWNDRIYLKMAKCVCLAWKLQYLPGAGIGATWKSQIWQPWVFRTLPSNALRFTLQCKTLRWDTTKYNTVRYVVEYIAMRYSTVRYDPVHCGEIRCAGERHHLTVPSCSGEAPRAVESKTRHNAVRIVVAEHYKQFWCFAVFWTEPQYSTLCCWMACMSGTWLVRLMLILIYTQYTHTYTQWLS